MGLLTYTISQGQIVTVPTNDVFWSDGVSDLAGALAEHGYGAQPEVSFGGNCLCIGVYGIDTARTRLAETYHYVAVYDFDSTFEIVLIPRLGDLIAFLNLNAPLCMADLRQTEHEERLERLRLRADIQPSKK